MTNPADRRDQVGSTRDATPAEIAHGVRRRRRGAARMESERRRGARAPAWNGPRICWRRAARTFHELLVREAGKTMSDAIAEVREAVDFCRYYALRARRQFAAPERLEGPTGESNELSLHGRGVFACISPWNFPLAIFAGQVTAALAAGNAVVAKPAEPTPLIAARFVQSAARGRRAAASAAPGADAGTAVRRGRAWRMPRSAGVAMTGSTATALTINRALAARGGAIVPLIAETGGMNAMIVDSTALPEQVVDDVVSSAFMSAGQRCSALRLLFLQEEIADHGAGDDRRRDGRTRHRRSVGSARPTWVRSSPRRRADGWRSTSSGCASEARIVKACALGEAHAHGSFFAPHLIELEDAGAADPRGIRTDPARRALSIRATSQQVLAGDPRQPLRPDAWACRRGWNRSGARCSQTPRSATPT